MFWVLVAMSILAGSTGQLLFKLSSGRIISLYTAVGVLIYFLSFFVWMKVLSLWPLSRAYPMLALNFVVVAVLAAVVLKEPFTPTKTIGTLFCIIGVAFIGLSGS